MSLSQLLIEKLAKQKTAWLKDYEIKTPKDNETPHPPAQGICRSLPTHEGAQDSCREKQSNKISN